MKILITGAAGFIRFHLCKRLILENQEVMGIDNFNDYYDVNLKKSRFLLLKNTAKSISGKFKFKKTDITNQKNFKKVFKDFRPTHVVHLAAQAGVRYSLKNTYEYINSNIVGFNNLLENCKELKIKHLLFASTSSVYGGNRNLPFKESVNVDHPINIYSATKKSNELIAHSYSHLYDLPCTGIRFFTVYGPWGRPDMALSKFVKSIIEGKSIEVYGNGVMIRDFTFIDDVIEGITRLLKKPPKKDENYNHLSPKPHTSWAPYKIFNLGNSNKIILNDYVAAIEDYLKIDAKKIYLPNQPGEMFATEADCNELKNWINFKPNTSLKKGIKEFIDWYKDYY